jgi:hypothetical protein
MTDITVTTTSMQNENRSWLLGGETTMAEGITLDVSLFTAATHYPNGFIPSGTVISPAGGPYSGTGAVAGILFGSLTVRPGVTKLGGAVLKAFVFVKKARLPYQTGTGSLGASGEAGLPLISFSA